MNRNSFVTAVYAVVEDIKGDLERFAGTRPADDDETVVMIVSE